jgi:hypothetical protein
VRRDRRIVAAERRSGDRRFGRLTAKLFQRAERQWQQRSAGLRFGQAGRLPERARRLGKERHLRARRQHGGRMVEGAGTIAGQERRHPKANGELREIRGCTGVAARNACGEALQRVSVGSAKRPQRVQGSRPRALPPRGGEGREPERAGEMRDELSWANLEPSTHLGDRLVGDREQDHVYVAQRRRLEPAAPVPGREHPHAGKGQRLEQRPCHRAAAQNCRGLDHSRRNSTPEPPAHASRVSPVFTRPARISSASGDSTSRWIVWRIGLAPNASWYPPEAIR